MPAQSLAHLPTANTQHLHELEQLNMHTFCLTRCFACSPFRMLAAKSSSSVSSGQVSMVLARSASMGGIALASTEILRLHHESQHIRCSKYGNPYKYTAWNVIQGY